MGKKEDLRKKADAAMCDLVWLAAIHRGVREREVENVAIMMAKAILHGKCRFDDPKFDKIFLEFSNFYKNNNNCVTPSDDTGHYLNKSAVVYADAIIQAFLDNTFSVIDPSDKLGGGSVGKKLCNLKKKEKLKPNYKEVKSANEVKFMAQLRHIITHNSGVIDGKFVENCEEFEITYDEQRFVIGNQVPLPIDEVVVPYLKHAFDFVDDHTNELIKCL